MSINGIGNLPYSPYQATFTSKRYNPPEDFKPGLIDPEAQERSKKRKKNILKAIGLSVVAAGLYLFLRKTNMGKNLLTKIKNLFKGSKSTVTGETVKGTRVATGTKAATEDVLNVGEELIRKNDKTAKVIKNIDTKHTNARTRKLVDSVKGDNPTVLQQAAYDKSIAYQAPTKDQLAWIEKNNKPAVNTIGDFAETAGKKKVKVSKTVTTAVTDKTAKLNNLQAKIAEMDARIAACAPEQSQTVKFLEREKARYVEQLASLNKPAASTTPVVTKTPVVKTTVTEPAVITPNEKAAQIKQAWAELAQTQKTAAPATKIPTADEIWAQAEAVQKAQKAAELEKLASLGLAS